MTRHIAAVLTLGALLGLSAACTGDEGGGGGGGEVDFVSGFAFLRDDNLDIYVADSSDYSTVGRLTTNGGNNHPSLSADGRQVVFVHASATDVFSIMTVATSGGGAPRTVYTADTTRGEKNFKNPVFSPDGTSIVFSYEILTTSYLAKVAALDGSGFTTLTPSSLSYGTASFYPSTLYPGEVLAAAGSGIGQYTQLERINLSTGQVLPVTNDLGPEVDAITGRAVLSKDGTKVAFEARQAGSSAVRIFVHTLASGQTVRISEPGAGSADALHTFPTWVSASQVAFVSDEGGAHQVYVQSATGTPGTGSLTLASADQPWFGP
jgi:Tol biopolymer transport system component